jgi:hypothetical protein
VVPLAPAPAPLRAGEIYGEASFDEVVAGLSVAVRGAYARARRPDELGS